GTSGATKSYRRRSWHRSTPRSTKPRSFHHPLRRACSMMCTARSPGISPSSVGSYWPTSRDRKLSPRGMASDVREYLRAAQAAEIRGDTVQAIELLRTAASAYQQAGNHPRAEQMLRHVRRLEARPAPVPRAVDPELTQRGPTLADPTQPAWCSFCCRPRDEVGPLVAGPAGAFISPPCPSHANSLLPSPASPPPSP